LRVAGWFPISPPFQGEHPDIDIIMDSDPRLIDFRRDQPQIAIRHSEEMARWPRSDSRPLFDVRMIAVIAPQLAETSAPIDQPADLLLHVLLHEDSHDLWARWFSAAGLEGIAPARGPVYADGALVQQAAIQGQGIGLVDEVFARDDLQAGRLRRLFAHSVDYGRYFLVTRDFDQLSEPGAAFVTWLTGAFDNASSDGPMPA
jgi:LysR substrate binding domain.